MARFDTHAIFPFRFGRYELLDSIGRGGMAEVFRARLPGAEGFAKIVVIKRLLSHLFGNSEIRRMFIDEAKFGASIHHKNIVATHSLGELAGGELYIEMEYVEGVDLKRLIAQAERAGMRVPPWLTLHVAIELLEALTFLHELTDAYGRSRNVAHCDVSPENVLLSKQGEVKLSDFGIVADDEHPRPILVDEARGKIGYMSPEQIGGERPTARADLFSFGVLLWECLAQKRLFAGATDAESIAMTCRADRIPPSRIMSDVPPELDGLVVSLLQVAPTRRPASALEVQDQLRTVLMRLNPRIARSDVREALAEIMTARPISFDRSQAIPVVRADDEDAFNAKTPITRPSRPPRDLSETGYAIIRPRGAPKLDTPIPAPGTASHLETDDITRRRTDEMAPIRARPSKVETRDILRAPDAAQAEASDIFSPSVALPGKGDRPGIVTWRGGIDEPFWLRVGADPLIGPVSVLEALPMLRRIIQAGQEDSVEISGDRLRFIPVSMFAALLGEEIVTQPAVLPGTAFSGDLETMSLTALIGRIAVLALSGRLVCAHRSGDFIERSDRRERGDRAERAEGADRLDRAERVGRGDRVERIDRREIHFAGGRLTTVLSNAGRLRTPDLLRESGLLEPSAVDACVRGAVLEREGLSALVARWHDVDMAPVMTRLMLQNLEEIFTWDVGSFGFDHECVPDPAPEAPMAVFGLLPVLIARSKTTEELHRALTPFLGEPMICAPQFSELTCHVGWDAEQQACLSLFGGGRTLGASLVQARAIADEKSTLVVGYLLRELGLLEPADRRVVP
ncbi:MAG: serine/threonine protein kinase [Deltaproteobacteria bacterium]|nr:serine/threonine protein kinase [Deltaproteobacteria bacterium]